MALAILFIVFAILLVLGAPVAIALILATVSAALAAGVPPIVVGQQAAADISGVGLLAIPLFVFAGELMLRGGISERIIAFASALVGRFRGGLAQVSVVASTLFGGVSGSAIADISAVGGTMIPQMAARGYDRDYAVSVTITAALVALLVPPSHNMILFSAAAGGGISITALFSAGIIPAGLLAIAVMTTAWLIAVRRGYQAEGAATLRVIATTLVTALPALVLVAIIFVGIKAGIFTAIESAAVAVVYAVLVTLLVYRALDWKGFVEAARGAARTTGSVLFVIGAAGAFGWMMAYLEVPAHAVETMQAIADDRLTVLLLMVLTLLVLGTFMDLAPLIIISTPIFLPVAKAFGIDPVHFGVVLILSAGIGLVTPPVGSVLFLGASIGKIGVLDAVRAMWPFYLAALVVLALVIVFPQLSLWLPTILA
jgi:tripartite ATP-independent transporter DctM subunit